MTATSRQRFLDTLEFKPVTKPWLRWGAFLWDETVERWRREGWDDTPLDDYFDLDRLLRVDPWYGPVPEFKHEVLAEDATTVTYVNHEGIVMREFKQHHDMSMPQFVKFPVETEAEFERFAAERLALNAPQRLSAEWMRDAGYFTANVVEPPDLAAAWGVTRPGTHPNTGYTIPLAPPRETTP